MFNLKAPFPPAGGQPQAIKDLTQGLKKHKKQTLLGITGSGKTYVMANVIQNYGRPTLILAHNKTLAAQLYAELKELFPENRVEYFISYYDYYQPESYLPTSDTYIEKEATINENIEKMRLSTTSALLSRDDVIVVASISCIYGLSNPEDFAKLALKLETKQKIKRQDLIIQLIDMQYERNAQSVEPGKFRVRGDTIDIVPATEKEIIRIELFGDEIDKISTVHHLTGDTIAQLDKIKIFPAKQFVVPEEKQVQAIQQIKEELEEHLPSLPELEQQRIKKRVKYDVEMIQEMGYCSGIENYSRHFDGRAKNTPPYVLLDYFPKDFLLIIDESHQSIPQSHGMYRGDLARKKNLVEYGFRLPCAFDNRPLKFEEFEKYFNHTIFVSATPGPYEKEHATNTAELIIRPTGLLDPTIDVRPIEGQMDNLIQEIKTTTERGARTLVTTLTKRMAEDLTNYLAKHDIKVRYMHSDIESLDRIELIRQLRAKEFDVLVGINLLREGLDIPEVELVAILDADKEGYLRNVTSLIQTIGRAARNVEGRVVMYADKITKSMREAISITRERRKAQILFNKKNNITPQQIVKRVAEKTREIRGTKHLADDTLEKQIIQIEADMKAAAESLDFEKAIELRDHLNHLRKEQEFRNGNE